MKFLSFIGIIAIIYSPLVFSSNADKIKVVSITPVYLSSEYFNQSTFKSEIVKKNETYSHMVAEFDLIKDIPLDTEVVVEVYRRSNSDCENYKKLNEYSIPFCTHDNDEYEAYMSDSIKSHSGTGKCVTKGHHHFDDVCFFAFYDLLSEEELKDARFKTLNSWKTGCKTYATIQVDYVSIE